MSWTCMAASISDTLASVGDFSANGINRVNAEVYRNFLCIYFPPNAPCSYSLDDISSFTRTITLSYQRAFQGKEVDLTD